MKSSLNLRLLVLKRRLISNEASLTYNLQGAADDNGLPAWLKAVQATKNRMN